MGWKIFISAAPKTSRVHCTYKQKQGQFIKTNEALLQKDAGSEDTDALFFDADGDGDEDLYVCSGGNEFSPNSTDTDRPVVHQ